MFSLGEQSRPHSGFSMREPRRRANHPIIKVLSATAGALLLEGITIGPPPQFAQDGQVNASETSQACRPGQDIVKDPTGSLIVDLKASLAERLSPNTTFGGYLDRATNGSFYLTDCPPVVEVIFTLQDTPTPDRDLIIIRRGQSTLLTLQDTSTPDKNLIVIRRGPSIGGDDESHNVYPSSIKTAYAVRVLGTENIHPDFGQITVQQNGKSVTGGLWLMLTDISGNPVHPTNGRTLNPREGAYYVAPTFATVIGKPSQPAA